MLNLASLLSNQGKSKEAQELYQRSIEISNSEMADGKAGNERENTNGQNIAKDVNIKDILDMKIISPSTIEGDSDDNLLAEDSFFQAIRSK